MNMHINVIYYQAIVENYFTSRFIQSQSKWYTVHIIIVRATDVKVLIFHFLMVDTRITMVIKQTKKATRVTVSQLVTDKLNYIKLYQLHLNCIPFGLGLYESWGKIIFNNCLIVDYIYMHIHILVLTWDKRYSLLHRLTIDSI
jgi:hypothetical protein